jgi:hypothetical protein
MKKFLIEREIPGIGTFEREQLREAAAKSNDVLRQLGPKIPFVLQNYFSETLPDRTALFTRTIF